MRIKVNNCAGFSGVIDIIDEQVTIQPYKDWPKIPEDAYDRIIFRRLQGENKFDHSFYSASLTNGIISENELNNTIQTLHEIIQKNSFNGKTFVYRYYVLFCLMSLGIIIGCVLPALKSFFALTLISIIIPSFIFLLGFMLQTRSLLVAQKLIYQQSKKYIEDQNYKYAKLGVHWIIPKHFPIWLELKLDYKSSSMPNNIMMENQTTKLSPEDLVLDLNINSDDDRNNFFNPYKRRSEL